MAKADGDITLSVNIEASDVETAANSIKGRLENIFAQMSGKTGLSDTFKSAQVSAASLYDEITKVQTKIAELKATAASKGASADLGDPNTAFGAQYSQLTNILNGLTNRATIVTDRLQTMSQVNPPTTKFEGLANTLRNVANGAGQAATSIAKIVGSAIKSKILGLTKSLTGLAKSTKSQNNALQIGFKNFIRYGLGVRSIFALINKLRRALFEGIGNLAQYSPEFNRVISDFISALATLKNAFATAFAPILSVALPLLTSLMNALVDAISLIGRFFASLTGHNTFIQAKHVNKDYAASLNKTGRSANNATRGINGAKEAAEDLQRTIAGFDDVEILHENKPSSSSSSGGSGAGSGAGTKLSPADMFETVGIESPIADLAKRLRELIMNQDWTGLGQFLGEKINAIFQKAKDIISWDNLGTKITEIVNAITKTFNSLIDTIDWNLIGSTFAEGINTVIKTLDLLITGIDWALLGRSIAEGWNGLFSNIDWLGAGKLIGDGIVAVFDFLYDAITTFKWEDLGKNLATALYKVFRTVNWNKVGKTFANAVNGVFKLLYGFITNFNWAAATSRLMVAINSFIHNVDWKRIGATLGELIKALLQTFKTIIAEFDWRGLGTAIAQFLGGIDWAGLISEVLSAIVQLGISLIQSTLGLSSGFATTLVDILAGVAGKIRDYFKQYGGDIVQGLIDGIVAAIKGIGKWIEDNVVNPIIDAFKSAFGIASPSKVMRQMGTFVMQGLLQGISSTWTTVSNFFKNAITTISNFFKNFNWREAGATVIQKLHSGISNTWGTVSSFFNNGVNTIRNLINSSNWSGSGNTIVTKLKTGVSSLWNSSLVSYIRTGISGITNTIKNTNWTATGTSIVSKLRSGLVNSWSHISSFARSGVYQLMSTFQSSGWYNIGANICAGIANGIRAGWSWVSSAAYNLARSAYYSARNALGIHSPSKVFKDLIGKMIPAGMAEGIEDESALAIQAVKNLSSAITNTDMPQLQIPSVALGEVIPYETTKNLDTMGETMKSLVDMLKYNQTNVVTKEDLTTILNTILPTLLQRYVSFYIGDEQIARHANAGNSTLDYRFNPVGK